MILIGLAAVVLLWRHIKDVMDMRKKTGKLRMILGNVLGFLSQGTTQ